jgi:hypothetical protein
MDDYERIKLLLMTKPVHIGSFYDEPRGVFITDLCIDPNIIKQYTVSEKSVTVCQKVILTLKSD